MRYIHLCIHAHTDSFMEWSYNLSCVIVFLQIVDPRIIAIEHDYSKRPLQLFWVDQLALQAIAESEEPIPLLTEVVTEPPQNYPRPRMLDTVAEFKVTPATHAGYAVTWYGLSAAGVYMTRKLITRGRG